MDYNFYITSDFAGDFKSLSKKNKRLNQDFDLFLSSFDHNLGNIIPDTSGAAKIRMSATGTGKRGGYRIIYYFFHESDIYFIRIYRKSFKTDVSESEKKEIRDLIQKIKEQHRKN